MKIYIDSECKCHTEDGEGRRAFEVPFFEGKCKAFIEGYRLIPEGEVWINPQGVECSGISPWKDYDQLAAAQAQYDAMQPEMTDMKEALNAMGVKGNG